jgi:uncharacterized LabA/DUF88 family protein
MKKVAILLDGEWFRRGLDQALKGRLSQGVTAGVMYRNAMLSLETGEELFRMFYYDCPPYEGKEVNPIDRVPVDFSTQPKHASRIRFLREMKAMDYVAMRLGTTKKRGWTLTENYVQQTIRCQATAQNHIAPLANDLFLSIEQKGVDMRIGIDVATLTLKRLVERIILISGDTDMIPAMKLTRREGAQVVLIEIAGPIHKELDEDADLVRRIIPVP